MARPRIPELAWIRQIGPRSWGFLLLVAGALAYWYFAGADQETTESFRQPVASFGAALPNDLPARIEAYRSAVVVDAIGEIVSVIVVCVGLVLLVAGPSVVRLIRGEPPPRPALIPPVAEAPAEPERERVTIL